MKTPNILFLFSDQHHADWVGYGGSIPVRTPHIDALAKRGVRFTSCRSASPMCAPSRACLATGRSYRRVGVRNNRFDLDPTLPTFMKRLRATGYRVEVTGKSDLHKKSQLHGPDGWSARLGLLGFTDAFDHAGKRDSPVSKGYPTPYEPYMRYMASHDLAGVIHEDYRRRADYEADGNGVPTWACPYPREHHIDDFGARAAIERLQSMPQQAPWFLQVNLGSPHPPFDAPPELGDRYRTVDFPDPVMPPDAPTDHQAVRRQYAASIEGIDGWIGKLLETLELRGETENTIVVYASDHGDMLGETKRWNKGFPEDGSVRVPMVIAGPGIARNEVCTDPVDLIDLSATFCEAASADAPEGCDAVSLMPALAAPADPDARVRTYSISGFEWWDLITDGRWKLIRFRHTGNDGAVSTGRTLTDLREDPLETRDLSRDLPEVADELDAALMEYLNQ